MRSRARPSAASGCAARPGRSRSSTVDRGAAEAVVAEALGAGDEAWLEPAQARRLLEAYGIPVVPERVVDTADDAVAAAAELGFPVVVKSAAAGAHKTESGGVALDLATRPRCARRSSGSASRCSSSR